MSSQEQMSGWQHPTSNTMMRPFQGVQMPPNMSMLPPHMQMQMQMMAMRGGMPQAGRGTYGGHVPAQQQQQQQQFMGPRGIPTFMPRPPQGPMPHMPMMDTHLSVRPPPPSSYYSGPGRGSPAAGVRPPSGTAMSSYPSWGRGRGHQPYQYNQDFRKGGSYGFPSRGAPYLAPEQPHRWGRANGPGPIPRDGESKQTVAKKREDRPDILEMTYEEYLVAFRRFKSGEQEEHSVKEDASLRADGTGRDAGDKEDKVGAQKKQILMTEEQYIAYCRKFTAQMGMPFDEKQVKEHYKKMKAEYEASLATSITDDGKNT